MLKTKVCERLLGVCFLAISGATVSAPLSNLYVTSGDGSNGPTLFGIDSGTVAYQTTTSSLLLPIAVSDSIWLGPYSGAGPATEYDLDGNPTGNTNAVTGWGGADGTTNGVNNYSVSSFQGSGQVYQSDTQWGNLTPLFVASGMSDINGITFDTLTGTLWISGNDTVQNYSLTGALLSQFSHANGRGSLAYEPLTDTLWHVRNNSDQLAQYSKTGAFLQQVTVPGLSGNNWGAEFAIASTVPVPATLTLMGLGFAGLGYKRWSQAKE